MRLVVETIHLYGEFMEICVGLKYSWQEEDTATMFFWKCIRVEYDLFMCCHVENISCTSDE